MRACGGHNGMGPDAPSLGEGGTARLPDSDAGPTTVYLRTVDDAS